MDRPAVFVQLERTDRGKNAEAEDMVPLLTVDRCALLCGATVV